MEKVVCQLKRSDRVLIASHIHPDGDAIGSLIAMGLALDAWNKKTTLYNESSIPTVYRFLPAVDRIVSKLGAEFSKQRYDTVIILDCGTLQRIGSLSAMLKSGIAAAASRFGSCQIVNIDHHTTNTRFGDLHLIDESACATTEIVHRLIKRMGVPINRGIATSIYTGILTDTGSFRFSNTNKTAFEICDEMVAMGVDPYHVAKNVYGTYSLGRIKLLNMALDSIEISYNGRLSMMTVTRDMLDETGTDSEDIDGLIHYARRIQDIRVAVLIQEYQNGKKPDASLLPAGSEFGKKKFHVSLRSDGSVDVASIAADFGGGGHHTAAGFNIESSMSDLKNRMLGLAEKLER